jgi:hypothetical protein
MSLTNAYVMDCGGPPPLWPRKMPLLNGAFEFPRCVATKMPALRAF